MIADALDNIQTVVRDLLSSLPGRIIAAAALVGAIATLWRVAGPIVRAGLNWVGRHRRLQQRLQRLNCDVQVEYFQHILGEPAQYVNHKLDRVEHIFVFPEVYVQAVADEYGKVFYFSVTARTRRFRPLLNYHPAGADQFRDIRLGETRFADIHHAPNEVWGWLGARRGGYIEAYYFGNPGGYQTYVLALNDAAIASGEGQLGPIIPKGSPELSLSSYYSIEEWLPQETVQAFRRAATINTYGVVRPMQVMVTALLRDGFRFGPDLDQVRMSPTDTRLRRRRNRGRRRSLPP